MAKKSWVMRRGRAKLNAISVGGEVDEESCLLS